MDNEISTKQYFCLRLISYKGDKIQLLTEVRRLLNCNLELGKKFLSAQNSTILHTETEVLANDIKNMVGQIGIDTEVKRVLLLKEPIDLYSPKSETKTNILKRILFG